MTQTTNSDILIVGAGPAGLAVGDELQRAGYSVILLDKGAVAEAISQFPTFMTFFSTKDLLELDNFPLTIVGEKPSRREYLAYLSRFVKDRELNIQTRHEVTSIDRTPGLSPGEEGAFRVFARAYRAEKPIEFTARYIVIASGAWDNPNMLRVEGESLPHVTHRYREAHPYVGKRVLVVGGRNSAVEIALELFRAGADVHLSYRRDTIDGYGVKYWLKPDINNRLEKGEIGAHLGTTPVKFAPDHTMLKRLDSGEEYRLETDAVICMTGYSPNPMLLRGCGVEVDAETRRPTFDPETHETNIPGIYMAGVIMQGNMSGHIFIENSRDHGAVILEALKARDALLNVPRRTTSV